MTKGWSVVLVAAGLLAAASGAEARVVRIEAQGRAPIAGTFGPAGAYELISGRFFGELDPRDPKNAIIIADELSPAPLDANSFASSTAPAWRCSAC